MDQLVSFEVGEKYLVALGHGKIDSFASILILIETKDQYLSYKKIQINVNLTEAFKVVKRYETASPH
ncbi:MAG: hypothetical protein JNM78_17975 [Cyclobacteriaceae bacterium]|nr:hypothetical protein [Cyclobacteriaceae bacterium]